MPPPTRPLPPGVVAAARRQDGLVTRTQARSAGVSRAQLDGCLRHGRWSSILPGVYLVGRVELTARRWIRAATLWAGPEAVLLGVAALHWQRRTRTVPDRIEVAAPVRLRDPTTTPTGMPAIVTRRVQLADDWRVRWDGIWTIRTEYAIVQSLAGSGPDLLDEAVRRHHVDVAVVQEAARAMGIRPGSRRARQILGAAADGGISEAERLLHRQLRRSGIVGWRANVSVTMTVGACRETRVADVLFDDVPLIVEVDGFAWHTDHARFQDDRRRQNVLVDAGWTVLRFTWHDLDHRADQVVATVRRVRAALQWLS